MAQQNFNDVANATIDTGLITTKNQSFNVLGVSFNMIFVPGGTFSMGSDDEDNTKPIHDVTLGSFYIGETPVTQGLWQAVMLNNPSDFKNGDNYPVDSVTWDDCQTFIIALNALTGKTFRLPTEAEWEFAARGGKSGVTKYSGSDNLDEVAWYGDNSDVETHPVKTKQPNSLGIYDMSGNVWEWCQDSWDGTNNYISTPRDGSANASGTGRVLRGGSWLLSEDFCTVAYRDINYPDYKYDTNGLRLACSLV